MTMKTILFWITGFLLASILAGCSKQPESGAGTPRALVDRFTSAFETLDKEAVKSCFDPADEVSSAVGQVIGLSFDLTKMANDFEAAVRARFGETNAITRIKAVTACPLEIARRMKQVVGKARIEVNGDSASLHLPGEKTDPTRMTRKKGVWYFTTSGSLTTVTDLCKCIGIAQEHFISYFNTGTEALKAAETGEDFEEEMEKIQKDHMKNNKRFLQWSSHHLQKSG